jgi:hypothetical protein
LAGLACRSSGDWVEKVQLDGKVVLVVDHENIALSRIKINALKWMVARMTLLTFPRGAENLIQDA